MDMLSMFQVEHMKRGQDKISDSGVLVLKGSISLRQLADNKSNSKMADVGEKTIMTPYMYELNMEHKETEIRAETESLIIIFSLKSNNDVEKMRTNSIRMSQKLFADNGNIEKTFKKMSTLMKINN